METLTLKRSAWRWIAVALSSVLITAACATSRTVILRPVAGGQPLDTVFHTGWFATGGEVEVTFPNGETATGRWSSVNSGTDLGSIFVQTPSGPVSALSVASTGTPTGVATLSTADGLTLLCVYEGTKNSGVAFCTDSDGASYVGNW